MHLWKNQFVSSLLQPHLSSWLTLSIFHTPALLSLRIPTSLSVAFCLPSAAPVLLTQELSLYVMWWDGLSWKFTYSRSLRYSLTTDSFIDKQIIPAALSKVHVDQIVGLWSCMHSGFLSFCEKQPEIMASQGKASKQAGKQASRQASEQTNKNSFSLYSTSCLEKTIFLKFFIITVLFYFKLMHGQSLCGSSLPWF